MFIRIIPSTVALAAFAFLPACGGSTSSTTTPTQGSDSVAESNTETEGFDEDGAMSVTPTVEHRGSARELLGVQPPPKPWAEMTRDEREMHMVANVLPIAAESFGGYDASRYAQFQCTSCHGDDAEAVHYALPTRFLPRLPAPGSEAWNTMAASPAFRFMAEHVVPDTARMIGQEPYNPATHQGFGCFGCHMGSGDAAATAAPATAPVAPAAAPTAPARGTRRTRHP